MHPKIDVEAKLTKGSWYCNEVCMLKRGRKEKRNKTIPTSH